jgi:hypothetical protein
MISERYHNLDTKAKANPLSLEEVKGNHHKILRLINCVFLLYFQMILMTIYS